MKTFLFGDQQRNHLLGARTQQGIAWYGGLEGGHSRFQVYHPAIVTISFIFTFKSTLNIVAVTC